MNIKIGSRKSNLAIMQTELVIAVLKNHFPDDTFEIIGISTKGDKQLDKSLQSFGGKGVFIKEIETALINGSIDMAIHSAKDMPTELHRDLEISAALLRADRSDVLVHCKNSAVNVIGTGSARRKSQAKKLFPNAVFKEIRGNINTRLAKLSAGEYDALIMAKAALDRLDITNFCISSLGEDFVCAAGQGILAVETVKGKMQKYTHAINDNIVMTELLSERAFLSFTGGGCHMPCGASAIYDGSQIKMKTYFGDTKKDVLFEGVGTDPLQLGKEMAEQTLKLLEKGRK